MLFNNDDFDFSFFEIPGSDFKLEINESKFLSPKEGFQRGNMMRDEYVPYKNYTYLRLVPSDEQECLLLKVMEYSFAINELNLYLDLNPEDMEAFRLFQNYIEEEKKYKKQYNKMYGPIVITDDDSNCYEWSKNPWPWDSLGGNMYV